MKRMAHTRAALRSDTALFAVIAAVIALSAGSQIRASHPDLEGRGEAQITTGAGSGRD